MNAAELFLLASGLYAHDSGMAVGTDEIAYLRSGAKDIATSDAFTPLDDERERLADFADRHVLYWRSARSAFWESRWPQLLRRMSAVRTRRSNRFESASSVAFSGPNKKVLYAKGAGMTGPDGKEYRTPEGVRNNAKAIYKIDMIAQGFMGRPK